MISEPADDTVTTDAPATDAVASSGSKWKARLRKGAKAYAVEKAAELLMFAPAVGALPPHIPSAAPPQAPILAAIELRASERPAPCYPTTAAGDGDMPQDRLKRLLREHNLHIPENPGEDRSR